MARGLLGAELRSASRDETKIRSGRPVLCPPWRGQRRMERRWLRKIDRKIESYILPAYRGGPTWRRRVRRHKQAVRRGVEGVLGELLSGQSGREAHGSHNGDHPREVARASALW